MGNAAVTSSATILLLALTLTGGLRPRFDVCAGQHVRIQIGVPCNWEFPILRVP